MAKKKDSLAPHGSVSTKEYTQTLAHLNKMVEQAQVKAVVAVNKEMIKLYWEFGKIITKKQEESGWGSSLIDKLVQDLQSEFPGIRGFSRANVFYMRAFYKAYEKVQQAVGQLPMSQIPWGHNVLIVTKLKSDQERLWYAQQTIDQG